MAYYRFTLGFIMYDLMQKYGIEPPTIPECENLVRDLMAEMCKAGYAEQDEEVRKMHTRISLANMSRIKGNR